MHYYTQDIFIQLSNCYNDEGDDNNSNDINNHLLTTNVCKVMERFESFSSLSQSQCLR